MRTKTTKREKWEDLGTNFVLHRNGYYVSFNPNTNSTPNNFTFNMIGSLLGGLDASGQPETALVKKVKNGERNVFMILNGDFRKQYQKCKSLKECIAFYKKNKDKQSNWSTDYEN